MDDTTTHQHGHEQQQTVLVDTPEGWDERYGAQHQMFSGDPNGALVAEVADLPAGRVLDVGCGEGADAVWLAQRGWQVTALDVSRVALDRGREAAAQAGVDVRWLHTGLVEAELEPEAYDLVSAQYPVLRRTPGHDAERALLRAVAPGGTLLVVHHAPDHERAREHGFDLADYLDPPAVQEALGDGWQVEVSERRARVAPRSGGGAHAVDDVVLRARRTG